jgi:hypothetical protein
MNEISSGRRFIKKDFEVQANQKSPPLPHRVKLRQQVVLMAGSWPCLCEG